MSAEFQPLAREHHEQLYNDWLEKHEFRPTALVVPIVSLDPLEVVISFGYHDNAPFFPQGGVEPHETTEEGAARELAEELGPIVLPRDIVYTGYARTKEFPLSQREKREYRGTLIYVCHTLIDPTQISPDMDEIVSFETADQDKLLKRVILSGDTTTARKTWEAFSIVKGSLSHG